METKAPSVRLEPWAETDLGLLRAMNAPELMSHLGGPETEEQLRLRHQRYVALSNAGQDKGRMFRIVLLPDTGGEREAAGPGEARGPAGAVSGLAATVGTIGFWENVWQGHQIYESGWGLLAAFQGRGIAAAAAAAVIECARVQHTHRYLHAFPSVDNPPSNAVCRRAGYTLQGICAFEYPPGNVLTCNDWRVDLTATG